MTDAIAPLRKNYAIMRFAKVRSWSTLRLIDQHNNRKGEVSENVRAGAPPPVERYDEELGRDFVAGVVAKLEQLGIPKRMVEGKILAVEAVTSASRGWFDAATDEDKEEWVQANLRWAQAKFGRGLVSAKLHLDEETWHVHFIAVPVVEKRPKVRGRKPTDPEKLRLREEIEAARAMRWTLSYEDVLGGHRSRLSREQDDYHAAVQHLGLERGEINPDVIEVHLGDELFRAVEEWERGQPRKSIPPQEYRQVIKRLKKDAQADRDAAEVLLAECREERERDERQREQHAADHRREVAEFKRKVEVEAAELERRSVAIARREADVGAAAAALEVRLQNVQDRERRVSDQARDVARREAAVDGREADVRDATTKADAVRVAVEADRAGLAVERAQFEAETELAGAQFRLLGRALHAERLMLVSDSGDRGVVMNAPVMKPEERAAYEAPWSAMMRGIAQAAADALARMRERFTSMMKELTDRAEELDRRRAAHEAAELTLREERQAFSKREYALARCERQAADFLEAWKAIPSEGRSPPVQKAVRKAGIVAQAAALEKFSAGIIKGEPERPASSPDRSRSRG